MIGPGIEANAVVFPAGAGMDRCARYWDLPPGSCSPRVRGWTDDPGVHFGVERVFPAGAGMDRCAEARSKVAARCSRGCGDGPLSYRNLVIDCEVFPAGAGMDRWTAEA